jgi:hypothetical protein
MGAATTRKIKYDKHDWNDDTLWPRGSTAIQKTVRGHFARNSVKDFIDVKGIVSNLVNDVIANAGGGTIVKATGRPLGSKNRRCYSNNYKNQR